jgi:multidrug efflux system membrane fusion protein
MTNSSIRRFWVWATVPAATLLVAYLFISGDTHGQAPSPPGRGTPSSGASGRGRGAGAIPVQVAVATTADIPIYLNGLGSVTSLNTVTVRSRVDGQLVDVAFREGQLVHKGDLLAQIDPRPFQVQLAQAEGQRAKDQAALENARRDLERYQALYKQDAVPRQQLDTQASAVAQVEASLTSDQAQVDSARLNLTYSRITAPISGRVGLRLVDPGNIVHASDSTGLVTITERQPIGVIFTIPEDSLPAVLAQLRAGRPLTVEAWDRELQNRLAAGTLLTVDNAIDQATGTVRLKATFANAQETLFPNQFVNARLLLDTLQHVVVVPTSAIQRNQQSTFAYTIRRDNTVEMRPVEVRLTEGDRAVVSNGLAAGDRVVVEGVDKLQQGTRVAVR